MKPVLVCLVLLLIVGSALAGSRDEETSKPRTKFKLKPESKKLTSAKAPPGVKLPSAKIPPGTKRPPGTLLLNMLIKNEREHLKRTLPRWAKIIDYWIIGVDDNNTDDSADIIKKELGHIPGEIVIVHFDGMGPTWSILVAEGIKKYPGATHGIIADADFMPMKDTLNKDELDIRCSKHMYTIWTEDHRNERKMDWIYRNIPGAVVKRRTHQILEVPELADQEVFQTLIDLPVEEREGGYGDRSGNKNKKYIMWLEKDLLEYPGDTRTLYYLGYAHFDIYNAAKDSPTQEHWDHLAKGVEYFKRRADIAEGNEEELWFALLKLGEIYERFYQDWATAEKYYKNCTDNDPLRADGWFYIGQHYRLRNEQDKAIPYLKTAATLDIPERSLFQWHYLYYCLSKLEYGRSISAKQDCSREELKDARRILKSANCVGGDPGNVGELNSLQELVEMRLAKGTGAAADPKTAEGKVASIKKLLQFVINNLDELETQLGQAKYKHIDDLPFEVEDRKISVFKVLLKLLEPMQEFNSGFRKLKDKPEEQKAFASCIKYRQATAPYLKFFKRSADEIARLVGKAKKMEEWNRINAIVRATCR